jgi:hypothetical protein
MQGWARGGGIAKRRGGSAHASSPRSAVEARRQPSGGVGAGGTLARTRCRRQTSGHTEGPRRANSARCRACQTVLARGTARRHDSSPGRHKHKYHHSWDDTQNASPWGAQEHPVVNTVGPLARTRVRARAHRTHHALEVPLEVPGPHTKPAGHSPAHCDEDRPVTLPTVPPGHGVHAANPVRAP